ncbi:hypothetical protein, partial [Arachidicoccus sp.]|uniref:hypothetical protein n=1 Tax=Arachidicoccus sp. TaxID=1872624 RepID=UPI003D226BC7
KGDNNIKQSFYVDKGNTITLKEAYNLLAGRAINKDLISKEGASYNAWMQLNFKQTNESGNYQMEKFYRQYGYDLKIALAKYPIKELAHAEDAAPLIASLKKGNRQSVTFMQEGKEIRHFIEANPKFFNIAVYDSSMQRIFLQPKNKEQNNVATSESETEKNDEKKAMKKEAEQTEETAGEKTKKKRKHVSIG